MVNSWENMLLQLIVPHIIVIMGKYLGVKLQPQMVSICLTLQEVAISFPKCFLLFYNTCSISLQTLAIVHLLKF